MLVIEHRDDDPQKSAHLRHTKRLRDSRHRCNAQRKLTHRVRPILAAGRRAKTHSLWQDLLTVPHPRPKVSGTLRFWRAHRGSLRPATQVPGWLYVRCQRGFLGCASRADRPWAGYCSSFSRTHCRSSVVSSRPLDRAIFLTRPVSRRGRSMLSEARFGRTNSGSSTFAGLAEGRPGLPRTPGGCYELNDSQNRISRRLVELRSGRSSLEAGLTAPAGDQCRRRHAAISHHGP